MCSRAKTARCTAAMRRERGRCGREPRGSRRNFRPRRLFPQRQDFESLPSAHRANRPSQSCARSPRCVPNPSHRRSNVRRRRAAIRQAVIRRARCGRRLLRPARRPATWSVSFAPASAPAEGRPRTLRPRPLLRRRSAVSYNAASHRALRHRSPRKQSRSKAPTRSRPPGGSARGARLPARHVVAAPMSVMINARSVRTRPAGIPRSPWRRRASAVALSAPVTSHRIRRARFKTGSVSVMRLWPL